MNGNDFIRLEALGFENITEEKGYHGVKTKFRAYIKNVKIPFSIDVGVDDVIVPEAVRRTASTRLSFVHLSIGVLFMSQIVLNK